MKKSFLVIALVIVCVLTLGLLAYVLINNRQASASLSYAPNSSNLIVYKGSMYYEATYVKKLLKPAKASTNVFVISNNQIYPTDGVKRDSSDNTAPAADQIKVELPRGYFYLAYKNYPNSLAEIPANYRSDAWAYEGNLYYNSGRVMSNNLEFCTKGGKVLAVAGIRNGTNACTMLIYTGGTVVDLRGTAKRILLERSVEAAAAQADAEE